MNRALKKLFTALILFFACLPLQAFTQNLTGIWRGYFITEGGEQYRYELQVEQTRSNRISGVSYSYLDTRFYGKAVLTGNFTKISKTALVQEIKTVEVKMSSGSVACIMKCLFTYSVSGKEEFLEGTFSSSYEKADPSMGTPKGGDCGGGKLFLRKVPTSDFYTEPFLRDKPQFKHKDTLTVRRPLPKTKTVTTKPAIKRQPPQHPLTKKPPQHKDQNTVTKSAADTVQRRTWDRIVNEKPVEKPKITVPVITRSRQNELVQTLTVTNQDIIIRLYDNGEVDDDTISVYMDGKPLALNRRLSTVPIILNIKMDDNNDEHTLVMYAENMGRIPPNTSLMIVQDGDKRYQVSIVSTEQKNAMVRFRYQKKPG